MKSYKLLLLLFFMTFVSISMAQDSCDKLITVITDKMTGRSTSQMISPVMISHDDGATGISIDMFRSKKMIVLFGNTYGNGSCIDDNAIAIFLFRDGSKINIPLRNDFNCKGRYTLYFGGSLGNSKHLDKISEKSIETIRIPTSNSYVQEDLTEEDSKMIMDTINCLLAK